jgi:aminoglycoside/choline kinase family phosphotransferase
MLVRYESGVRKENARYASHTEFLQNHGVRVPNVLLDLPEHNATLFHDAGTTDLESTAKGLTPKRLITIYKRVLDQLIKLHSIPIKDLKTIKLEPQFNNKLYAWERELFITHFLKSYLKLPKSKIKQINKELTQLADILTAAPQVLLHRDIQSSNILLNRGNPSIIDFQGMRMGVAEYDTASLLCDPYIMLSETEQNILLEYYWKKTVGRRVLFTAASIQRLSQALGAFARLSKLPDLQRYEQYILPACTMMLRMLKNREDMPELTERMKSIAVNNF